MRVRSPAVAGTFYPADTDTLQHEVREFLAAGRGEREGRPKALIAPHAGYVYSGPVAGFAYAALGSVSHCIERVVLLGPSHFVHFRGLALPDAGALATPLGEVRVDRRGERLLDGQDCVASLASAHAREHSLEVQLPFLQLVLDTFEVVPLVTGEASPEEVFAALRALWGGDETLIVVSSDLSHYLDYDSARRLDRDTATAIERLRPDDLRPGSACGRLAVQGLLLAAKEYGLEVETLDLRNSGDTAGPRHEVVGYGAFAFSARGA